MAVQLRLKAMNSQRVILSQFKEIDLSLLEYEDFLNTVFVKIPIDYRQNEYKRLLRLIKKISKETGRWIVPIPENVGLFQVEQIRQGEADDKD